jgi:protein-disulfide isomerase
VTIIEFSDFECPYCRLSVPVIKEVQAKYPGRVNVVYRDFPGPTHSHASQAAEAARCAGEQGKFWEYHDLLFERQKPNAGWDFSALAKEIGLEHSGFVACLGAGRYRDTVSKDLREGLRLGISSTPTYFVNGRPLVGLHSVADFQAVIDRLLQEPPRP